MWLHCGKSQIGVADMIERIVVLPVSREDLWTALTDPAEIGEWFGADIDWELQPGGLVHGRDDDGGLRDGYISAVEEGRLLRFSWWPRDDRSQASEVTYRLEPDAEGSQLTVTERPLVANASASNQRNAHRWTTWDDRVLRVFAVTCRVAVRT